MGANPFRDSPCCRRIHVGQSCNYVTGLEVILRSPFMQCRLLEPVP
jgi:hypothetical protein